MRISDWSSDVCSSDLWNAHGQVASCSNASCSVAVNAGIDMFMAPDSWRALYASTLAQVKDGTIPMARLDDAVLRVLRVKQRLGLFDAVKTSARAYSGRYAPYGPPELRSVVRAAGRHSTADRKTACLDKGVMAS